MIKTIILFNADLSTQTAYFISNLSYIKDNLTGIKSINGGFRIDCRFKATKKKQKEIKKFLKQVTGASEINFVIDDK